jgi:hypothetical protein
VAEKSPPPAKEMLLESLQETLVKAIVADLVDVLPIGGDISSLSVLRGAASLSTDDRGRLARQLFNVVNNKNRLLGRGYGAARF